MQTSVTAPVFDALRKLYVDCLFGYASFKSILNVELPRIYEDLANALDAVSVDDDDPMAVDDEETATAVLLSHLANKLFTTTADLERKYRDLSSELSKRGWWDSQDSPRPPDDGTLPPPIGFDALEWVRLWEWRLREGHSAKIKAASRITALRISETKLQLILILESLRISRITGEPLVRATNESPAAAKKRCRRRSDRRDADDEDLIVIKNLAKGDEIMVDMLRFVEYGIDILSIQDVLNTGEMSGFVENVLNEFYLQYLPDIVAFISQRAGLNQADDDTSSDEEGEYPAVGGSDQEDVECHDQIESHTATSMPSSISASRRGSGMAGKKMLSGLKKSSSTLSTSADDKDPPLPLNTRTTNSRPRQFRSKMVEGLAKKQFRTSGSGSDGSRSLTKTLGKERRRKKPVDELGDDAGSLKTVSDTNTAGTLQKARNAERISSRMKKAEALMEKLMDPRAISAALNGKQRRRASTSSTASFASLSASAGGLCVKGDGRRSSGTSLQSEKERLKRSLALTTRLRGSSAFSSKGSTLDTTTITTTTTTSSSSASASTDRHPVNIVVQPPTSSSSSSASLATPRKFPGTPSKKSTPQQRDVSSARKRLSFGLNIIPQSTGKVIAPFMEADWDEIHDVNLDSPIREPRGGAGFVVGDTPCGVKKVVKIKSARKRQMRPLEPLFF